MSVGPDARDLGVLVPTAGSVALSLIEETPGPSVTEIESVANQLLVATLDAASGVTFRQEEGELVAHVQGVRFHLPYMAYERVLGSPLASIVATVVAEGLDQPVEISGERADGDTLEVRLIPR